MTVKPQPTSRFGRVKADSCCKKSKLDGMIFNRASRDLDIVERDGVIAELLIIFVSLARNQYNVARSGERNSAIDGLGAIDDLFIVIRTKSFFDLRNDGARVF